jgi:hypothetical protein
VRKGKKKKDMCIGQKKREGTKIKCWGPKVETKKNNEK